MTVTFDAQIQAATKVCERLGTWVLYAIRDARDLEHFVGYLIYKVDDFDRRKRRSRSATTRAYYSQRIGHWRRAIRWVASLDREFYGALAERIIEYLEAHPRLRSLPYVAPGEVCPGTKGGRAKLREKPTRRAGRPRTRAPRESPMEACTHCGGVGPAP